MAGAAARDGAGAAPGLQSFEAATRPEQGPPRLARLRAEMEKEGLDAFLVPRADAHQGEYVAARDERLAWLTGFTGSAGLCAALRGEAGLFVDGRYRLQARAQAAEEFTPVDSVATKPGDWLAARLPEGGRVGLDPWLHTPAEAARLEARLAKAGIGLVETDNLVDRVRSDVPPRPSAPAEAYPKALAGRGDESKREAIAKDLRAAGCRAAALTLPDSICWLLNLRGSDVPRTPVVQAFAILGEDGRVGLFSDPAKFAPLGPDPAIDVAGWDEFPAALAALEGPVLVDPDTAPLAVLRALEGAGVEVRRGQDPCILPKACKTEAEIAGTREAHLRDAAAMCEFLAWLDAEAPGGGLTEIDAVRALEGFRQATGALRDISFDTICGSGPHGAIVHYRVTRKTNRAIAPGDLVLVDSGGQYLDGTTDVTRTVAIGEPADERRRCFTRVLQGWIAIGRARWPEGLAGRDLDPLARAALWRAGQDYDHGTGHGVGCFLGVHEGPQRLARGSAVPLRPGMIVSNEPGCYREGAFGIRTENLVVVREAPELPDGDGRKMLEFETLTWVPVDRALVDADMLSGEERAWLDDYHASVREKVADRLGEAARAWLERAARPL